MMFNRNLSPLARFTVLAGLSLVAACGGGSGESQSLAPDDPVQTIADFLTAAGENDLVAMATLWGTERGSAVSRMDPADLRARLTTMQIYLNNTSFTILGTTLPMSEGSGLRRTYLVEIERPTGCRTQFPMEMVQSKQGGWYVVNLDLNEVGNPRRRCDNP